VARRNSQSMRPHVESHPRLRSPLILLVDDSVDARLLIGEYLVDAGFLVEAVANGNQAVTCALSLMHDPILMDLDMPELDGWEAARLLRSYRSTRQVPILALSGLHDAQSVARAMSAGCDRFVPKPFLPQELEGTIREALREADAKWKDPLGG
jgi:CheY-like chemotaxis protein